MGKGSRKKAERRLAREQEKRARKHERAELPQNNTNQLKLKSISEYQKMGIGEMIGQQMHLAWYFEKWYEKMILVLLSALGMWKIVGFIL